MRGGFRVLRYSRTDKMCDLVYGDYNMLLVLGSFGIEMGFKDNSIEQVCQAGGVDVDTFLAVVNYLISSDRRSIDVSAISLESLVRYLKSSHGYFTGYKLPYIRTRLLESIPKDSPIYGAVISYYDEYVEEVHRHIGEESVVFSYVERLLTAEGDEQFDIDLYSDRHESMDSKLSELKSIIIKYYPVASTYELSSVLIDIFACEESLLAHSDIEDYILIPAIRQFKERSQRDE